MENDTKPVGGNKVCALPAFLYFSTVRANGHFTPSQIDPATTYLGCPCGRLSMAVRLLDRSFKDARVASAAGHHQVRDIGRTV